jgi:DNA polymerase-3 subunit epsilon
MARRRHPAGPNSLDALCRRYGIDNTQRTKHGAIMDSLLLAAVYVELLGERQASLVLAGNEAQSTRTSRGARPESKMRPEPLPSRLSADEVKAHAAFVETLGANALWRKYLPEQESAGAKPDEAAAG